MKLLLEAPINSLSLGNVSYNFLRELYKKDIDVGLWPIGKADLEAYQPDESFMGKVKDSVDRRYDFLNEDIPVLKVWHLNGSENRKNPKQFLYSFYECNLPTPVEKRLCDHQTETIFSSSYAAYHFGAKYIPLGFDPDFHITDKKYLDDVIHFGLMGKFENRKHTAKIIQTWLKKYGNNPRYQLSCLVNNPFYKPEDMKRTINAVLGDQRWTNINFLPHLKTNKEVNQFLNSIDIDLTGLSGGEGFNLPAFNATCLGKWSIVLDATSHRDWATKDNSILITPSGAMEVYDDKFFKKGSMFNQGAFYTWTTDEAIFAMEMAESKVGEFNKQGEKLSKELTYSKTVDSILEVINRNCPVSGEAN